MPSPLPGMDPYLESPRYWTDFHDSFITYAREDLQPRLPPRYRARIGEWVVVEATERVMIPDVAVVRQPAARPSGSAVVALEADEPTIIAGLADDLRQPYLEIVDRSGDRVVTAIELLSPVNKAPGEGRSRYQEKQAQALRSGTNLVEVDLLHGGAHTAVVPPSNLRRQDPYHSLVCVWRASRPLDCEVYFVRLPSRLPRIRVPLLPEDPDVVLDVQATFNRCYDAARYDLDVDYAQPPPVALPPADSAWLEAHLREAGLRA